MDNKELVYTRKDGFVLQWTSDLIKEFKGVTFKSKNVMVYQFKNIDEIEGIHPKYKTFITRNVLSYEPSKLVILQYISVAYQYITIQAYLDKNNKIKKLYVTFNYMDYLLTQSRISRDITIDKYVGNFPLSEYMWLINNVENLPPVLEIKDLDDVGLSFKGIKFNKGDVIELSNPLDKVNGVIESLVPIEKLIIKIGENNFTEKIGEVTIFDSNGLPIPMIDVVGTFNNDLLKELGSKQQVYKYYYDNEKIEQEGIMEMYLKDNADNLSELDILRYKKEQVNIVKKSVNDLVYEKFVDWYDRNDIKRLIESFNTMNVIEYKYEY